MEILQVSSTDLVGQRFNGQFLTQKFPLYGHNCNQLVWDKEGNTENTHQMFSFPGQKTLQKVSGKIEELLSIRAVLHPSSMLIKYNKFFKAADVVHYHLLQWPNFFSLLSLPELTRRKPAVWTIHDFWPMTGHCVYPFSCDRWTLGCGQCPFLKTEFTMRKDRTSEMWKYKKKVYNKSKIEIVTASKYMQEKVKRSPLFENFNIHYVPFGLDLNICKPIDPAFSRKLLGIAEDEIVIAFRSSNSSFKGLSFLRDALKQIKTEKPICLVTFDQKWNLEEFRESYKIIDLGWVHDESLFQHAMDATDFFVMPSIQETFGVMAIEAMAFGKPVIVFEGTALPGVIGGNENGFVVESGNTKKLIEAMEALINNPDLRMSKGEKSLTYVKNNYSLDDHIHGLLEVYKQAIDSFVR